MVCADEAGYSSKIDVWAVGISILYMAQGQPPYHDVNPMRALFLISTAPSPTFADATKWRCVGPCFDRDA